MSISCVAANSITVHNNFDHAIEGPFHFKSDVVEGHWSAGTARMFAENSAVDGFVSMDAGGTLDLHAEEVSHGLEAELLKVGENGTLHVRNRAGQEAEISFLFGSWYYGQVEGFNLESQSQLFSFEVTENSDGSYLLHGKLDAWKLMVAVRPYRGRTGRLWLDLDARLTRVTGGKSQEGVAALIRKVVWSGAQPKHKLSWMSLEQDSYGQRHAQGMTPQFGTIQDVDWFNLTDGNGGLQSFHLFNPTFSTELDANRLVSANSFLIRERFHSDLDKNTYYLVSDIASPGKKNTGMMAIVPERLPDLGDEVKIRWVMAMGDAMDSSSVRQHFDGLTALCTFEETETERRLDIGVPFVEFGTAYFPYSTETENFGYYRVKGHDRDGWWPFSVDLWEQWAQFKERIRVDLRLIKSQGYDQVRQHWLSHLNVMDWEVTFDYMDFIYEEADKVGLTMMYDSKGSAEWQGELAKRYGSRTPEIQIDNEQFLIGAVKSSVGDFIEQYDAVNQYSPNSKTYTATLMNIADTIKLKEMGVPIERVCLHAYAHFHQMKAEHIQVLGNLSRMMAMHGNELGLPTVCTEFNWKFLTHVDPDIQKQRVYEMYKEILAPRSFPLFFQFQWQETFAANPAMSRQGYRHYEYMHQDRRPKSMLEGMQDAIEPYLRPDHLHRKLAGSFDEAVAGKNGALSWNGWIENKTNQALPVTILLEGFEGLEMGFDKASEVVLGAGERRRIDLKGHLPASALPGHYYGFVRIELGDDCRYIPLSASKVSNLTLSEEPFLSEMIEYKPSLKALSSIDFVAKPVVVVFSDKRSIMDLEMASLLRETIQSATGQSTYLYSDSNPKLKAFGKDALYVVVGTSQHPWVRALNPALAIKKGHVEWIPDSPYGEVLLFSANENGTRNPELHAAAVDFVMRYWPSAKDSSMRIAGYENGTQLDNAVKEGALNTF
jgi:hypothetical protein